MSETRKFIGGHKTLMDGSRVPLSEAEAERLWSGIEAATAKRASDMPTARDALAALIRAEERLRDLGWWKGGGLRVRRGDDCAVAEPGSTGMWSGHYASDGGYVYFSDCVSEPRKVYLKPLTELTDDERSHLEKCDRDNAEWVAGMGKRLSMLGGPTNV